MGGSSDERAMEYEFFGPVGTAFMTLTLPLFVIYLSLACGSKDCQLYPEDLYERVADMFSAEFLWHAASGVVVLVAYIALHAFFYHVLPTRVVKGTILADGTRLSYPIHALRCVLCVGSVLVWVHINMASLTTIVHSIEALSVASCAICVALSLWLYASSFSRQPNGKPKVLAHGGNTGNTIYDFFMGRELNPTAFGIDLKYICELRPGLMGWLLINIAMTLYQWETHGSVTNSMWLVLIMEAVYVADAWWFEHCIISTMDITTDGFGYMLCFGDLSWVPFTYTLQARYLAHNPVVLGTFHFWAIVSLFLLGMYIFRSSNYQKDAYRRDPDSPSHRDMKYIQTKRGTRLLADGWWGMSRHVNYLGDWLQAVAWCLPCGFDSPLPYFYAAYFAVLLIHREARDDAKCSAKYGEDWERYCSKVPYHIIPGIY